MILWGLTWLIIPSLVVLLAGFFTIRHIIKKRRAKKAERALANEKAKDKDNSKQKAKENTKALDKQAERNAKKQAKQNKQNEAKQNAPVERREDPKAQLHASTKHLRFDLRDADLIAKNPQLYADLQEATLGLKYAKNSQDIAENKQKVEALNKEYVNQFGRTPHNVLIPADCAQKASGCYCFNGYGSSNLSNYLSSSGYDAKNDSNKRIIAQFEQGNNKPILSFCVDGNNSEMLYAAVNDINASVAKTVKKDGTYPTVRIVTSENGKLDKVSTISYKTFIDGVNKALGVDDEKTPVTTTTPVTATTPVTTHTATTAPAPEK